ncbi:unnamed protein product [Arabidopsis thaliana]|uniref:(thale cress) hypothetical protein n=1 Tax=Arabidopsis thaliana TaxID=3702 RepID=A0A5S9XFP0_ARATH|nr:unnamed protein product [Arabidopsis thaliana]CAD5324074.1 unnamed protein product [Arabidopsis thaliana]
MSELLFRLNFLLLLLLSCVSLASSFFSFNDPVVGLGACGPYQIQAFTQFKNEFDTHACNHSDSLNGVWCDNSTGAVMKLRLRACLSGTLKSNSSLFQFHQLRYLYLSYNNFTPSSIPSEFGMLNKLEVLFMSTGGFLGQVPSSFSLEIFCLISVTNTALLGLNARMDYHNNLCPKYPENATVNQ